MTPESAFLIVNYGVLPFWLLLLIAPDWKGTRVLVHSAAIPALLGVVYILTIVRAPIPEGAGGASLKAAMLAFSEPWTALACWIHYVVADLFLGAWVARDGARFRIRRWVIAPCLIATNQFAPAGLLLYLAIRGVQRRTLSVDEVL